MTKNDNKKKIWEEQPYEVKKEYLNKALNINAINELWMKERQANSNTLNFTDKDKCAILDKLALQSIDINNDRINYFMQKLKENYARAMFYQDNEQRPIELTDKQKEKIKNITEIKRIHDLWNKFDRENNKEINILKEAILAEPNINKQKYFISERLIDVSSSIISIDKIGMEWISAKKPYHLQIELFQKWLYYDNFSKAIKDINYLSKLQDLYFNMSFQTENKKIEDIGTKKELETYINFKNRDKVSAMIGMCKNYNLLNTNNSNSGKTISAISLIVYNKWSNRNITFSKWKDVFLKLCEAKSNTYKPNQLENEVARLQEKHYFLMDKELDNIERNYKNCQ